MRTMYRIRMTDYNLNHWRLEHNTARFFTRWEELKTFNSKAEAEQSMVEHIHERNERKNSIVVYDETGKPL